MLDLAVAGAPTTWEQSAAAALLALPGSALSHPSAARVHRFFSFADDGSIVVSTHLAAHHALPGVRVRRTRVLAAHHVTVVGGLAVTTRARTIVDLAADLHDARLQRVIEEELDNKLVTWDELLRTLAEMSGRGRRGIGRVRPVIEKIEGLPPTESQLERMYPRLLIDAGLPLPSTQVTAPWAEREPGRVDCMYPDALSIIELDGRTFHQRNSAFETDRYRDQLAKLQGWSATRFTYTR